MFVLSKFNRSNRDVRVVVGTGSVVEVVEVGSVVVGSRVVVVVVLGVVVVVVLGVVVVVVVDDVVLLVVLEVVLFSRDSRVVKETGEVLLADWSHR